MNTVGNNIKYYREILKIKKKELAEQLGYDASIITRYENGERTPTLDVLIKLSRIFGVSLEKLAAEKNDPIQMAARNCGEVSTEDRKELMVFETLASDYIHLLVDAGMDPTYKGPTYQPAYIEGKIPEIKESLGLSEVVDVEQLMAGLRVRWNVQIFELPFRKRNMSGLTFRIQNTMIVFLNKGHIKERRLFSLAHELCHVLCHLTETSCVTSILSSRDEREKVANRFAEKFLIPDDRFMKEFQKVNLHIGKQEAVKTLAERFHVSPECMFQDLCHRGYIKQNWSSYKATSQYEKEYPLEWDAGDLPYLYTIAVYFNVKKQKISLAKAAQYLHANIRDVEGLMNDLDWLFQEDEKK
jgi:Zn-dependent peptidase ImmA (M78 family)